MEKLVRVLSQSTLRSTDWQAPDGTIKVIKSVEVVLTDGIDSIVAEANDSLAEAIAANPLDTSLLHNARITMQVKKRHSDASSGRMFNVVRLQSICAL